MRLVLAFVATGLCALGAGAALVVGVAPGRTLATATQHVAPTEVAYRTASVDLAAKRYAQARAGFDRVIADTPDHRLAHYSRAIANFKLGDFDAALRDYSAQLAIRPDDAYAYWGRAQTFNKRGDYRAAVVDVDRALALNSRLAGAIYHRAYALYRLGSHELALRDAEAGLAIDPNSDCLPGLIADIQRALERADCEELLISNLALPRTTAALLQSLNRQG